ncbi:hypothetical protein [Nocardioides yefusunii]|uniref:Uncharacterized protein n=1 Tax=Nocardioides yefusunii TaxID=2500546 RepID=A0ABW1QZS8_9ACTN|nr:hypothetical protein [Nocardioides yefusunii]
MSVSIGATATPRSTFLVLLAPLLSALAVGVHYALTQSTLDWWWGDLAVGAVLLALGVAGAVSVRRQVAGIYLATALVLPFALGAVGHLAVHQQLTSPSDAVPGTSSRAAVSSTDLPLTAIAAATAVATPMGGTATVQGYEVKMVMGLCGVPWIEIEPRGSEASATRTPAAAGTEFCQLTSSWTNATSEPLDTRPLDSLRRVHTAAGLTHTATSDDEALSVASNRSLHDGTVNAGETVTHRTVVSVPLGSRVGWALAAGAEQGDAVVAFALS